MEYYVTKKAGSIMVRRPRVAQIIAGEQIPADIWEAIDSRVRAEYLASGLVRGWNDPDVVPPAPKPVGVRDGEFSPEATIQPGDRKDQVLQQMLREEARRRSQARKAAEVDVDAGGSADGVVSVEMPPEDQEDMDDEEGGSGERLDLDDSDFDIEDV